MKKRILTVLAVSALAVCVACSQTLLQQIQGYVNTLLPVVETVANIVIATEAPEAAQLAQTVEAAVNAGVQQIEQLVATINAGNATTVRGQIVNVADAVKAQLAGLLAAGQVKNPATVSKVTQLVSAADLMIDSIVQAIPAQQTTGLTASQKVKVDMAVSTFKHQYNVILDSKTGDAKVDAALGKSKKFRHWYGKQF